MANPDISLTLLSQALEQAGAASLQAQARAAERDQEIAALRRDLADMTQQRDTLRAQLATAGNMEDVRKRLKDSVADALAAERTRYDERTKVLRAAKRELDGETDEAEASTSRKRGRYVVESGMTRDVSPTIDTIGTSPGTAFVRTSTSRPHGRISIRNPSLRVSKTLTFRPQASLPPGQHIRFADSEGTD